MITLYKIRISAFTLLSLFILTSCDEISNSDIDTPAIINSVSKSFAQTSAQNVRDEVSVELAPNLSLSLWASDSLVSDPIAISMDPHGGIYYTQGNRIEHSEFDIRGHRDWMTESISWQTVEERRAFIQETFTDNSEQSLKHLEDLNMDSVLNWHDLTVEQEEVWKVSDTDQDGIADQAQLYIRDFHEEISDLANGVEYSEGKVFVAVGPDLWLTEDTNNDGIADYKKSLAHGFAVHIGFGAHGMSGVIRGPDGRLYWGIGDIGMNLIDQTGKQWKYPNQGVIVRCDIDGSNFEVFSAGHRNTHEFVFDKYGNLITEDNDGDHGGERERLVYIINGSDSGWRINWQFGKYTDPKNNKYKVWMDEKLSIPHWEGQAAYILPPIQNYVNGPTGMVYNPGTALSSEWADHFFISEFVGTPAISPIHGFTLKQDGAGFALDQTKVVAKGLLPTGLDFSPDGDLYFGDWIDGWGAKHKGRIWKLESDDSDYDIIQQETKNLLAQSFNDYSIDKLNSLLSHQDMRIRNKAQFEISDRGEEGYDGFINVLEKSTHQLARIHAIWGIGQMARTTSQNGDELYSLLNDPDEEIIAQALKTIGDIRLNNNSSDIIQLVNHTNKRISLFATEALGRLKAKNGQPSIIEMIRKNNDRDMWLRHAGAIALGRIGDADYLASFSSDPSISVRLMCVVALRRMGSHKIADYLTDENEWVVTEAARGINDDWSIEEALQPLASILNSTPFSNEALIRRSINANLRHGTVENINNLKTYASNSHNPTDLRAEAIYTLSTWNDPSVLDRVDGRYRGAVKRSANMKAELDQLISSQLSSNNEEVVNALLSTIETVESNQYDEQIKSLIVNHPSAKVRALATNTIANIKSPLTQSAVSLALSDKDEMVRSAALASVSQSSLAEEAILELFDPILKSGSITEKQTVIKSIGNMNSPLATAKILELFTSLKSNKLAHEINLDVVDAITSNGDEQLNSNLTEFLQSINPSSDLMTSYNMALYGGDRKRGQDIFYNHEGAQCMRCHAIFEWGGDAGPVLSGVGSRLDKVGLLESLIAPSATIAAGYALASFDMGQDQIVSGTIKSESDDRVELKLPEGEIVSIMKKGIKNRIDIPSSMINAKDILSKSEIRDLVEFLSSLKR